MPIPRRRVRGPHLLLSSAVALGLVVGIGLGFVGPSPVAVRSNPIDSPDPTASPRAVPTEAPSRAGSGETGAGTSTDGSPDTATPASPPSDVVPPLASLTGYQWPLPHARITLPFGPTPWGTRVVEGDKFHDGVDLATFCGDRVVAAHDGTVIAAGRHFDHAMGWLGDLTRYTKRLDARHLWGTLPIVVVVDDGNGYRSVYAHFGRIVVKRGQAVTAGSLLGFEGATGHASGCHLHYGLFSPAETSAFLIERAVAKRMKLPAAEIARVDPMVVLPPRSRPTN